MTLLDRPEGRLAIALAVGLIIGAERERRKSEGPTRIPAGVRTFALVGLLGGIVALLGSTALLVVVATIVGSLAIAGYFLGDRSDPGFTTETALIVTYCLGALAQREPKIALATGLAAATLLAFRTHLHSAVRSVISEDELRDGLIFGVAALVVLPLLPNRAVDPLGVLNPFTLWRLVVLLMAMSGAGYIAQRAIGPRYGLALAGFGAGFASSSATIAAMGARARADAELQRPAIAGAAASTVATFVQLAILVGAANGRLLVVLAWPLAAGGATALAYAAVQTWHARRVEAGPVKGHAFKISTAVLFAVLVTAIAFISAAAQQWAGAVGAVVAAAIAGFADAHASSAAVAALSAGNQIGLVAAEIAVLVAFTTNTVTKAVLAAISGPRRFSVSIIAGLVLVLAVTWGAALVYLLRHG
jgi:uncharacterized membrane protein (DUF4010 family)